MGFPDEIVCGSVGEIRFVNETKLLETKAYYNNFKKYIYMQRGQLNHKDLRIYINQDQT